MQDLARALLSETQLIVDHDKIELYYIYIKPIEYRI